VTTRARQRLLCVDDEDNILAALRRVFADEHYDVVFAKSGAEGLALLEREPVGVVLSDQRMPGMSGTEFLRQVRARWPETMRIILSGFAELSVVVAAINDGEINKFIGKPWDDDALREAVRACIEQHSLNVESRAESEEIRQENDSLRAFNMDLELRNRALELYQDLIEQVPIGLVGVGADGTIALANSHSRDLIFTGSDPSLGLDYRDALPQPIAEHVSASIAEDQGRFCVIEASESPCQRTLEARITPLRPSARERGVLIVLIPAGEGIAA
jgi:FixJ family two-component response regulator